MGGKGPGPRWVGVGVPAASSSPWAPRTTTRYSVAPGTGLQDTRTRCPGSSVARRSVTGPSGRSVPVGGHSVRGGPGPLPPPLRRRPRPGALTRGDHGGGRGHLPALQQRVEREAVLGARLQPFQLVAGHLRGQHQLLGRLPACGRRARSGAPDPTPRPPPARPPAHPPAPTALSPPLQPVSAGLGDQVPGQEDGGGAQEDGAQRLLHGSVCPGTWRSAAPAPVPAHPPTRLRTVPASHRCEPSGRRRAPRSGRAGRSRSLRSRIPAAGRRAARSPARGPAPAAAGARLLEGGARGGQGGRGWARAGLSLGAARLPPASPPARPPSGPGCLANEGTAGGGATPTHHPQGTSSAPLAHRSGAARSHGSRWPPARPARPPGGCGRWHSALLAPAPPGRLCGGRSHQGLVSGEKWG